MYQPFSPALELNVASEEEIPAAAARTDARWEPPKWSSSAVGYCSVLFHAVEGDFGCNVVNCFLGLFCLSETAVVLLDIVKTIVAVVVEDVVGVCSGCILGESDTTGHIRSEPDLVEEHRTCTDDFKGCLDGVVGVLAVCLDHVGEVSELDATWLVRATCTSGGQDICHLDNTGVLCCKCEVSDCCLTGAHLVRTDEGHTDLHCGPPGGRSTVAGSADGCRNVNCLPH